MNRPKMERDVEMILAEVPSKTKIPTPKLTNHISVHERSKKLKQPRKDLRQRLPSQSNESQRSQAPMPRPYWWRFR